MTRLFSRCSLVFCVIETCLFTFCEEQEYEIMPHYIKKSQTHEYNLNRNQEMHKLRSARKSNTFDYNYEDWEDKKPDYYNFFINTSDSSVTQTQTTQTAITTTTTPSTAMITSPTEDNKQQPTETTITTTGTNTETPVKTERLTSSTTTTVSTSTTSQIPEFPDQTEDIFQPTTVTVQTTTKPVRNPIVDEIIQVHKAHREGYFTAGLIVSLKKLADKKPEDLEPLLTGLHNEVIRLNRKDELMMFGYIVSQTLASMVALASDSPVDAIQVQAKNGVTVLLNRRDEMSPDWNAILDVADAIFNEDDLRRVANYLREVQKYPNTTKSAIDIARDAIRALIIIPYERIEGTAKEKLLVLEIQNAVKHRVQEGIGTSRRLVGGAAGEAISKNKYLKDVEKFIFRKKTTQRTSSTIFMEYARNATILATMKHKMKLYKKKFRLINKKEKGSSRRGPTTTTTTTTTTTPRPPMYKSNYYIRRYVKKNLYKMTTTTEKTTVFKIRYYGKIRKFNIDSDTRSDLTYTQSNGSDSEGYYSDTEYNNDNIQTDISFETKQSKHKQDVIKTDNKKAQLNPDDTKNLNRFYTRTDPIRSILDINTDKHLNNIINKLTNKDTDVEVVDDEDYLTVQMNNALYHKTNLETVNDRRRFITDVREEYSLSDTEIELKRNLYRAMNDPKL